MSGHPAVAAAARLHQLVDSRIGDTVSVDLGPKPGRTSSLDAVVIGLSTEDTSVISGSTQYDAPRMQAEAWEIGCMAQSVSGDEDPLAALSRVYELMDEVGAALLADLDSDAGITWQGITRHQAQWVSTDAGPGALLMFWVDATAHRGRTTG